jgi:8-oxo-dGTP diphosphatase
MPQTLVVVAAVIEQDDRFLLTRRLSGTHLEGCWEFPGGKCEPGETLEKCLQREIREELDAEVTVGQKILEVPFTYPDRRVELHFFKCSLAGPPQPLLGQEIRWVARTGLRGMDLPPADAQLVDMLTAHQVSD